MSWVASLKKAQIIGGPTPASRKGVGRKKHGMPGIDHQSQARYSLDPYNSSETGVAIPTLTDEDAEPREVE